MAAVDGVRPIGYAVCECYADPQSHTTVAMLHHVFLLPEYRRRGIVEQGMEYIRTWAFGCGATHLGVISRRRGSMMRWMGFQFSGYYRGMEYLTCPIVRPEGATHVSLS
jgi:GNAT superfamily N-acetyltransferase